MKIEKVDCEDHLNGLAIKKFMILSENSSSFLFSTKIIREVIISLVYSLEYTFKNTEGAI